MATTEGPVLPEGAIDFADPQDVLRAAQSSSSPRQSIANMMPSSKRNLIIIPESSIKPKPEVGLDVGVGTGEQQRNTSSTDQSKSSLPQIATETKASFPNATWPANAPRISVQNNTCEHQVEKRMKTKQKTKTPKKSKHDKSKTPYPEMRKQSGGSRENADKSNVDHGSNLRRVPVEFKEWQLPIEKVIDELVEGMSTFKSLATFEPGSILDYVEMIGITRREAFKGFPETSPLPVVPNTLRIKALDAFMNTLDTARVTQEPPTGPFMLSEGEHTLAKALEIESRRADLLEHQVKMLRSELLMALKRWEVFLVAISPDVADDAMKEEKQRIYQQRLQQLESFMTLTGTKRIMVLQEHEKVINAFRDRHNKVKKHGFRGDAKFDGGRQKAEAETASSSETESSLWSSSSEEEDD